MPGVTTADLDQLAETQIRAAGAVPSFKGYQPHRGVPPFPGSICASVNDEIVHGIPGGRMLGDGDIISIDCGAILDGWHGDAAVTVAVGDVPDEVRELIRVTEESMWRGLAAGRLGGRVSDIGHAVESYVRSQGEYGIVEEYGGHGIGTEMHQEPHVLNYGRPGRGPRLQKGLALAVEPMLTLGSPRTGSSTTSGRSRPRTVGGPRTSSTPSPSRPTGRGSSQRSTVAAPSWTASRPRAPRRPAEGHVTVSGQPPDPQEPTLRASDADRDAVADRLREAHAEGRLTVEEFTERLDAALVARTHGDLVPLTRDLPSPTQPARRRGPATRRGRRAGRRARAGSRPPGAPGWSSSWPTC